jgi:uncharacterized lipoprotein YmbA
LINRVSCAAIVLLGLTGCASDPAPIEQLRLTEQALAQAKAVGADEHVAELVMAEDKLLQAQSAMRHDAFREARVLAEQAELDARLAQAQVLTQKSQDQLNELNNRINRLRKQLGEL